MPPEPQIKRTYCFFDGQNLFKAAQKAFGYSYPNYDPLALATTICNANGWTLSKIFFYTGVHSASGNQFWNHFWNRKLAVMGTRGIEIFTRTLKYRNKTVALDNGMAATVLVGQEKGIDVRLALDVVRSALRREYDVAVIFSQDQDLSEAANEIKEISISHNRWIKVACAFPTSPTYDNTRGIHGTEWIRITRQTYDACLDPNDYRPKNPTGAGI